MKDDNWELINGQDAHDIEILNYSNQINVIEALLRFFLHHAGVKDGGCPLCPNCTTLKELHRTGTLFLLALPGSYRDSGVNVVAADGSIVHAPPSADQVPELMEGFSQQLGAVWLEASPIEIAAFCLWRINWIHPFKNGNGRTARAFAYACLCLKFGFFLPGTSTVIDLIMVNRDEYQKALKVADESYAEKGTADLAPMEEFVERLIIEQLSSLDGTK